MLALYLLRTGFKPWPFMLKSQSRAAFLKLVMQAKASLAVVRPALAEGEGLPNFESEMNTVIGDVGSRQKKKK